MTAQPIPSRIGALSGQEPGSRSLTRYCRDLRHLIYWMENDRSLGARPGKIRELREMLSDMEAKLSHADADPEVGSTVLHLGR